jgi:carboxyl-terminal processing protease
MGLKYKTLKGRTVYGGGGIIPDIFVPLNKKFETDKKIGW